MGLVTMVWPLRITGPGETAGHTSQNLVSGRTPAWSAWKSFKSSGALSNVPFRSACRCQRCQRPEPLRNRDRRRLKSGSKCWNRSWSGSGQQHDAIEAARVRTDGVRRARRVVSRGDWETQVVPIARGRNSIFLDEPIGAVVAADEDVSENIRRNRIRTGDEAAILENIHRRPRTRASSAFAKNPLASARSRDDEIAVCVSRNTARLAGVVRDELVIIHRRPRVAAVGALAHDPVG